MKQKSIPNILAKTHYQPVKAPRTLLDSLCQTILRESTIPMKTVYGKKAALQDVSVAFAPGQIVGLFGENGAGKTTLMKCILGLIGHRGEVTLDGEAIGCGNIARLSFATCEHSFFPRLSPNPERSGRIIKVEKIINQWGQEVP